ncbi:MAG: DUF4249 family protein, partial [Chitinophagaceae bacterium]
MTQRFNILFFLLAIILLIDGCEKPFTPKINEITTNILVVDGFINAGADSTIVKLSRTALISEKQTSKPIKSISL